jgi:hypothetical protein
VSKGENVQCGERVADRTFRKFRIVQQEGVGCATRRANSMENQYVGISDKLPRMAESAPTEIAKADFDRMPKQGDTP